MPIIIDRHPIRKIKNNVSNPQPALTSLANVCLLEGRDPAVDHYRALDRPSLELCGFE